MSNSLKLLNLFFSRNIFLGSFNSLEKISISNLPECCFIGRSNVGKSSMINAITKSKKLAKTSKTPGRTQNINLFTFDKTINIADLPGYGFAKLSKLKRKELAELIEDYIKHRTNLKEVFVLIDCKVGIKNSDIDMIDTIVESKKKFSIILTKIDKCSINFIENQKKSLLSIAKNYTLFFKKIYSISSVKKTGIINIQKEIYNLSKI